MNFLTKVGNWEVSATSWRKSARRVPLTDSQAVADRVQCELMRTLKQWITQYWVRRTSPKRTNRHAKFNVKLAFTLPVSIGSFTVIFNSSAVSDVVRNKCLKPPRHLSDSLQIAAERRRWFCGRFRMVHERKSVYRWTTIHFAERSGLRAGRNQEAIQPSHLLRTRSTFSKSVMVSIAVSKMGVTELMLVDPRVKVNGQYYRNVLLSQ